MVILLLEHRSQSKVLVESRNRRMRLRKERKIQWSEMAISQQHEVQIACYGRRWNAQGRVSGCRCVKMALARVRPRRRANHHRR